MSNTPDLTSPPVGITCPTCGCSHLPVVYTRRAPLHRIKRVRQCRNCGRRVVSYEKVPETLASTLGN